MALRLHRPAELATPFGVLLVDPTDLDGELLQPAGLSVPHLDAAGRAEIATSLPPDVGLCGLTLATRALDLGSGLRPTNALDLTFGIH